MKKFCCPNCADVALSKYLARLFTKGIEKAPSEDMEEILAGILVAFLDAQYLMLVSAYEQAKRDIIDDDDPRYCLDQAESRLKVLTPLRSMAEARHKDLFKIAKEVMDLLIHFKMGDDFINH